MASRDYSFSGEFQHTLDEKGRVSLPQRLRGGMLENDVDKGFYVTRGHEGCLVLYSRDEWERIFAGVSALEGSSPADRAYLRLFIGKSHPVTLDRQGRFVIPESLARSVGIDKDSDKKEEREIVFVGVGRRIEIWSRKGFESYERDIAATYDALSAEVHARVGLAPVLPPAGPEAKA